VPVEDRARLFTNRGSGYLAHAFEDDPQIVSIRHILYAPPHPQTNGKIERFIRPYWQRDSG
jgi:transposase InsO family protein